jgi:hypothetical protein
VRLIEQEKHSKPKTRYKTDSEGRLTTKFRPDYQTSDQIIQTADYSDVGNQITQTRFV